MAHTSATSGTKGTTGKQVRGQSSKQKTVVTGNSPGDGMDRQAMIAVAAYYRAERRGFSGGDPMADWLAAEAEVNAMFGGSEAAAY